MSTDGPSIQEGSPADEGSPVQDHSGLDAHHRATVNKLFNHPVGHNIQWHDVLSLLRSVGEVTENADGCVTVTVGAETETFAPPRHHDMDEQQVVDLRRMLKGAGITPT